MYRFAQLPPVSGNKNWSLINCNVFGNLVADGLTGKDPAEPTAPGLILRCKKKVGLQREGTLVEH